MKQWRFSGIPSWLLISMVGLLSFSGFVYANPMVSRTTYQVVDGAGDVVRTLRENHALPEGHFDLAARIQLPSVTVDKIEKHISLKMTAETASDQLHSTNPKLQVGLSGIGKSLPNLLNSDELWVTYRSKLSADPCHISGRLAVRLLPFATTERAPSNARTIHVKFGPHKTHQIFVNLDNGLAQPRTVEYLLQEQTGRHHIDRWQLVTRHNNRTYERLLNLNMRNLDQIKLVMDPAVSTVNVRLSRLRSGMPTNVWDWDQIPKTEYIKNGMHVVVLDVGALVKDAFHGEGHGSLQLVELIAHSHLSIVGAPVKSLTATYVKAGSNQKNIGSGYSERIGSGLWRWRISLRSLQRSDLTALDLLKGEITNEGDKCVQGFKKAELVQLGTQKAPSVFVAAREKLRHWGGPFAALSSGHSGTIEWPTIVTNLPLATFASHEKRPELTTLETRHILARLGIKIKSEDNFLGTDIKAGVLALKGKGKVSLEWKTGVKLPSHAFLFIKTAQSTRHTKVILHFSDGSSEAIPSTFGDALDLSRFAGKVLDRVEWRFSFPKSGSISISELVLFNVDAVTPSQALAMPQPEWSWEDPSIIWLDNGPDAGRSYGEINQTINSRLADMAAFRIRYDLSAPPLRPDWLKLTIESKGHIESMRLHPVGLSGSLLVSNHGRIFDSLKPNAYIDKVRWSVVNGALPVGESALLQVDSAHFNSASIADRVLSSFNIELAGRVYTPRPPTGKDWQDLASSSQAWLDFGDIYWPGGSIAIKQSNLSPAMDKVTQWRISYKTSMGKNLRNWLKTESAAAAADRPYMRWIKLSLLLLILLGVLLLRRNAIQPKLSMLWRSSCVLTNRFGQALFLSVRAIRDFIYVQRRALNVLMTASAWLGCIYYIATWEPSSALASASVGPALLLVTFFALLHAWRWDISSQAQLSNKYVRYWLVGDKRMPPLIIWVIIAIVFCYRIFDVSLLESFLDSINANDLGSFGSLILHLAYYNPMVMVGGLGLLFPVAELKEYPLLWMALLYGILPWLMEWGYWLILPSSRLARWMLVILVFYGLGLMRFGHASQDYYFSAGGIAAIVAWRIWTLKSRIWLESRWPRVAEYVYSSVGSIYFSGALISLAMTAIFSILSVKLVSEQLAMLVYYFLIVGAVLEIARLRKGRTHASS